MSSRDQNKFEGKRLSANFNARAKLQPEDHRRILMSRITSEEGRRDLERLTRAGDRYEQRRVEAEIIAPRMNRMKEAQEAVLKHRLPPPNFAPPGWGTQRGGVSANEAKMQRIVQLAENWLAAKDIEGRANIHRTRCSLDIPRLEKLVAKEAERQAAERAKQKDSAGKDAGREPSSRTSAEFRQAARARSSMATAFRQAARDTGRGD